MFMKLNMFIIVAIFLTISGLLVAEEEKEGTGISVGLETGYGDVLTYGEGFEFRMKPNIGWNIMNSGFSLGLGWVVPVYPFGVGAPHEIELSESYEIGMGDSGFEVEFGNVNSFALVEPVGVGGFIFVGIGYSGFSLDIQAHYLAETAFGFNGLVFIPGYSLEMGDSEIGISFEIGMWPGEPITWTIEPVIGFSYSF
jgi:hypothetical protein